MRQQGIPDATITRLLDSPRSLALSWSSRWNRTRCGRGEHQLIEANVCFSFDRPAAPTMLAAARLTARAAVGSCRRPLAAWSHRCATVCRAAPAAGSTRSIHSSRRCRHGPHDYKPSHPITAAASSPPSSSAVAAATAGAASSPAARSFPQMARGLLRQFRLVAHHYKLGAKLLWSNLKRARAIRRRLSNAHPKPATLTYSESLHLHRFRTDMALGIPFVVVGALPIVGNLAPLFAWLCPRYIPATFHFPSQTLQHVRADGRSARALLASLRQVYSFHAHSCGLDKLRGMLERIEKGVGKFDRVDSLAPLASLFQELTPSPALYTRHHLLLVHRALVHSGFIPKYAYTRGMLVRSLERWADRIWSEDQLLLGAGAVHALDTPVLVSALYDRGLYRQPILMAAVLARAQREALDGVDGDRARAIAAGKELPPPAFLPSLPPPPSAKLVAEWREALEQWVHMHATLRAETKAKAEAHAALASAAGATPHSSHSHEAKDKHAASSSASHTATSSTTKSATPATPPDAPTFPLSFLIHAGPIGRIASSQADIAAVPPLDA